MPRSCDRTHFLCCAVIFSHFAIFLRSKYWKICVFFEFKTRQILKDFVTPKNIFSDSKKTFVVLLHSFKKVFICKSNPTQQLLWELSITWKKKHYLPLFLKNLYLLRMTDFNFVNSKCTNVWKTFLKAVEYVLTSIT